MVVDTAIAWEITCNADDNGEAEVVISGGVDHLPYIYLWNDPPASATSRITGLAIGEYIVLITDANGCTLSDTLYIKQPKPVAITFEIKSDDWYNGEMISCAGASDGAVLAIGSGGRLPYDFLWSTGDQNAGVLRDSVSGLSAGIYNLTITDIAGCDTFASVTVTEPHLLNAIAIIESNVSCWDHSDGSLDLRPRGGVEPYTYRWWHERWGEASTEDIENLYAGNYYLTMFDLNGCRMDTSYTIIQPEELTVEIIVDSVPTCPDSYDGIIHISITGGTEPYSVWWPEETSSDTILFNLGQDVYIVLVDDDNFCPTAMDTVIMIADAQNCLTIPTAISPNGDGKNDTWRIPGIEYYPEAIIEIYNRWGDLVFRSDKGYGNKFDGIYRGRNLPVDSYHFIINLNNGSRPILGNVTVIR